MTDEINDKGFEPVGPANAEVANPVLNFLLYTELKLNVGDFIQTKLDGFFQVTDQGQSAQLGRLMGGDYYVKRVEKDDVGEAKITYLESYGIQVR